MTKHKYDLEKHPNVKIYLEENLQKPYGRSNLDYDLILEIMVELHKKNITHSYRGIINRHDNIDAIKAIDVLSHSGLLDVKQHYCNLSSKGNCFAEKLEEMLRYI